MVHQRAADDDFNEFRFFFHSQVVNTKLVFPSTVMM